MMELSPGDRVAFERFRAWKHRSKVYRLGSDAEPTTQQIYANLMKEAFAPALRTAGLRGSGGRFELPSDEFWAQLGFQKSAYSDSNTLKFTINLSVIGRAVWAEQAAKKPYLGKKPSPLIHYGDWADQIRIGALTTSSEDLWWWLHAGDDPRPVEQEVVAMLVGLAVPWLIARASA